MGYALKKSGMQNNSFKAVRYGFKRKRLESNPSSRIEYIYDAIGKTPMYIDISNNSQPIWGSGDTWEKFCYDIATPVMLNYDGTEAYELDRNDQTKRADNGEPSDISNPSFEGNAMVRFAGFPWVHRSHDDVYDYIVFCNVKYDETYHTYANINEKSQIATAFYWGMFKGSYLDGKLRSLADQIVMTEQTRDMEVTRAQANGVGYDTIYKSGWDYINDLLTLISKSDDGQSAFGGGRNNASSVSKTGTLKDQKEFWGSNDNISDIKVFFIEGYWGNIWEGMRGFINDNGHFKTKMTPPYNFDGTGYFDTGIVPSGVSGGYVEQALISDESGYIPKQVTGSETTYYCDGCWFNNSQLDYAIVGGYYPDTGRVGPRDLHLYRGFNFSQYNIGSRLSYIPWR